MYGQEQTAEGASGGAPHSASGGASARSNLSSRRPHTSPARHRHRSEGTPQKLLRPPPRNSGGCSAGDAVDRTLGSTLEMSIAGGGGAAAAVGGAPRPSGMSNWRSPDWFSALATSTAAGRDGAAVAARVHACSRQAGASSWNARHVSRASRGWSRARTAVLVLPVAEAEVRNAQIDERHAVLDHDCVERRAARRRRGLLGRARCGGGKVSSGGTTRAANSRFGELQARGA